MIIIFEPQCTGFGHEQFNAAFLYGYSLAYPNEKIIYFAEKEHIKCIKDVFSSANLSLNEIVFTETEIPESNSLANPRVVFEYSRILKNLLSYAYKNDCNKIVFLSIYTYNLIPLKYLLQFKYNNSIQVHIAMHGTLEFIKRKNFSLLSEFYQKVENRFRKVFGIAKRQLKYKPKNRYLYEKLFKISLQLFSNKNITYFVFREDSLKKIKKYLPKIHKYFKSIDLPYIYKNVKNNFDSEFSNLKIFATFGKGYTNELNEIVRVLTQDSALANNFEIRIIGDIANEKLTIFKQIKYVGINGKPSREEIEEHIRDVKYFLFFYPPDSYELTTSGAFFDAIAYCKPIIFLKNHCLDYYYDKYKFGYIRNNIDELISAMKRIILSNDENYHYFLSEINRMQKDISIVKNNHKLRFNEENN